MGLTEIACEIFSKIEEEYYPNNEWFSLMRQICVWTDGGKTDKKVPKGIEKLKISQGTKAILKAIDIDDELFPFQLPELRRVFKYGNEEDKILKDAIGSFEIVGMVNGSVCLFAPELRTDLVLDSSARRGSEIRFEGFCTGLNKEMENFLYDLYYKIPKEERGWYFYGREQLSSNTDIVCTLCKKFSVNIHYTPNGYRDTLDVYKEFIILRLGDFYFLNVNPEKKPYGYLLGVLAALSTQASSDVI